MKIQSNGHSVPVMVIGNDVVNNMGVVRNLGRHGITTVLLSSNRQDIVRYSRYLNRKLTFPNPRESETRFIEFLLNHGSQTDKKHVIITSSDEAVIALSRYKEQLEQYYLLPIPHFETVEKLVNKKKFYQFLAQMSIPHPRTYFPKDISELKRISHDIEYPYIIKPSYRHLFYREFDVKCFVIECSQDLDDAIRRLKNKDLEVIIQEIIRGKDIYMFYTYFNRESEPCATCGYDKLRQSPPDFGNGSLCRSAWKADPIDVALRVLKVLKYHGMAEPEFKKDPRDGVYKLLEINPRTTTESKLPAECGVNIEYIAYLDITGQFKGNSVSPKNGIVWIDDINDIRSCIKQIRKGTLSIKEVIKSYRGKRVHSIAAWDDPLPFVISLLTYAVYYMKELFCREKSDR